MKYSYDLPTAEGLRQGSSGVRQGFDRPRQRSAGVSRGSAGVRQATAGLYNWAKPQILTCGLYNTGELSDNAMYWLIHDQV